jgi:hypothetical protein
VSKSGLRRVNGNSSPVEGPFLGEKLIPNQGKIVWKKSLKNVLEKSGMFFPMEGLSAIATVKINVTS